MMKKDMSNIWRVDLGRGHFYRVVFSTLEIDECFSDGIYGGKRKAQDAAIKYRDQVKKQYKLSYTGKGLTRGNYRDAKGYFKRGNSWIAFWTEAVKSKRKQRQKSFSISEYGTRKAKALAIAWRKAHI